MKKANNFLKTTYETSERTQLRSKHTVNLCNNYNCLIRQPEAGRWSASVPFLHMCAAWAHVATNTCVHPPRWKIMSLLIYKTELILKHESMYNPLWAPVSTIKPQICCLQTHIVGIIAAGDHTHHNTSLMPSRERVISGETFPPEVAFVYLCFSIRALASPSLENITI